MENNLSQKSGDDSKTYNVEIKGLPLSSQFFIWNSPVFSCEESPFSTSMYLSVSTSDTGTKYEISGITGGNG